MANTQDLDLVKAALAGEPAACAEIRSPEMQTQFGELMKVPVAPARTAPVSAPAEDVQGQALAEALSNFFD